MSRSEAAWMKWSRIIALQRRSGMSVARFCAERGIPASSLFGWKRRLADGAGAGVGRGVGPGATPAFVEAMVRGGGPEGREGRGVFIEVAGGRRVVVGRGFDRQLLLEVIEALESGAGS